jgi:methionine synthase II (cobalamin-independent)
MPARLANAELTDPAAIAAEVTPAIAETVKKQVEAGIDCIGDGEFWTARSLAHYTAHFTGIEARPVAPGEPIIGDLAASRTPVPAAVRVSAGAAGAPGCDLPRQRSALFLAPQTCGGAAS